jgi:putative ABC transport system permease protein
MTSVLRDLVYVWRGLMKRPSFFVAALLTLTVGIGATVTMFSLINAMALRPMPFGDRSDRLVTLHPAHRLSVREPGWGHSEISYRDLIDFRAATAVEGIGAYLSRSYVLSGDSAGAERIRGGSVTTDLFPLLGVEPIIGRHFRADEAAPPGLESVVMLTHGLWQRRFGSDTSIVGQPVIVNDRARIVVGVLPRGFKFPEGDELYTPLQLDALPRSARNVNAVALLRTGATPESAQAELTTIARQLETAYPETNAGFGVEVMPIRRTYIHRNAARTAAVLMAAVVFVLLIMCANLANLMLVRGTARQRELAVRAAMGASRERLLWIALCESLLIAVPGSLLGLLASRWALDAVVASLGSTLPYWVDFGIDLRVALFTMATGLLTALAVGLLPSVRAAAPDLVVDLKDTARGASLGRAGHRIQAALAVVQVALCFGLLTGANLMVRSFLAMGSTSLGFDHRPIISGGGYLAGDAFDDVRIRAAFFRDVTARLAALPGVAAAGLIGSIPGDDGGSARRLVTDGHTGDTDELGVELVSIGPTLFDTLNLPLLEGRTFTEQEAEDASADVAIINQRLASRLWPQAGAVDRRIGFQSGREVHWLRVVGVAPDVHYREVGSATEQSQLTVYVPYAMDGSRSMALLVRAQAGAPGSIMAPVRSILREAGPTFAIGRVMPMTELLRLTMSQEQLYGSLMTAFALIALLLACLGIYALVAYSVGRRSREIGVRLALGARPADVIDLLLRETIAIGGTGLIAGLILSAIVARALTVALYGVSVNAWLFGSTAIPLAAAILFATWLPARRAARIEPTIALRDE